MVGSIKKAFRAVVRGRGVSWAEAAALDAYAEPSAVAAARASEPDRDWETLVDDERWIFPSPSGGFAFLDPAGARYYLPAAMARAARGLAGDGRDLMLVLRAGPNALVFSALSQPQRDCVARFSEFMVDRAGVACAAGWREVAGAWRR